MKNMLQNDQSSVACSKPAETLVLENYVRVADDAMQAWLCLVAKDDGSSYTRDELKAYLSKEGVTCGYHDSNLAAMANKKVYGREVSVAIGTPYIEGSDGYYEYMVETEDYSKHPKIREDGSVDYQSMRLLQNVTAGQTLALYHQADMGTDGMDVRGRVLAAPKKKDISPLKGVGIEQKSDDPNCYIAMTDGKVSVRDGRLEICNVHEVHGDVDMLTGKVEFFGDVVIDGNVAAGVVIRTGKTLTINGTVEAAQIYAGGDVVLKRGVQGNEKAVIRTKGNLYADFLEHCRVEADGNISANYFLNTNIEAEGNVVATGKRGMILGGYVHGFQSVTAMSIGNDTETKTVVHAGCKPELYDKKLENYKKEQLLAAELKDTEDDLKQALREQPIQKNNSVFQKKLKDLTEKKNQLVQKVEQLKAEKASLLNQMNESQTSTVCAQEKIYAGTIVSVNNAQITIPATTCYMKYENVSGTIEGKVIRI